MEQYGPKIEKTRTFYTILEDDSNEIVDCNGMSVGEYSYDMNTLLVDEQDKECLIVSFLEVNDSENKVLYTEEELDKLKGIVKWLNENKEADFTIIKFTHCQYSFLEFDTVKLGE